MEVWTFEAKAFFRQRRARLGPQEGVASQDAASLHTVETQLVC